MSGNWSRMLDIPYFTIIEYHGVNAAIDTLSDFDSTMISKSARPSALSQFSSFLFDV